MNCSRVGLFKGRKAPRALYAAIAVAGAVAQAADYTWMSSPADAYWNTTSLNWNSGEAWVDGNNAIFGSSSSKTVTLDGARTVGDMTFRDGYTINGSDSLTITGKVSSTGGTVTLNAPLNDSNGEGLHFVHNRHIFLYKANAHIGGTYLYYNGTYNPASDLESVLGLSAGDNALGPAPDSPRYNIFAMGTYGVLFAPNINVELNANRHIWIKSGTWFGLAGQGSRTFRVKGEIHGEIPSGNTYPTDTHLRACYRSDWPCHVVLDPGDGHTNDIGTVSAVGWLEIASGVTRVTASANSIGDGTAVVYVASPFDNPTAYNSYMARLTISGGELYVPAIGDRRFNATKYANVEINGGRANMPTVEYLNGLTGPATLTIANGGELLCREFRLSQYNGGGGGVLNLNSGGKLTASVFRMDGAFLATVNMNGGIISRRAGYGEDVFTVGHRNQPASDFANITCNVLEGGAIFEPTNGCNIFLKWPLKSGVAEGETDGGLTVRGSDIFVLQVAGSDYNGPTRLEHGARMQCRVANALPSGTTLQMGPDTSIGFNVWTNYEDLAQTVARLEGCGRVFRNSLLTVTEAVAPVFDGVYGTLTFEKACSLYGDYEITGDANGCSCIKLESGSSAYPTKQDISGLTLKVADFSALDKTAPKRRYKILDAPHGYAGAFNPGNVADPWAVAYTATAAYLHYVEGTTFSVR